MVAVLSADGFDPDLVRRMLAAAPHRGSRHQVLTHRGCGLGVAWSDAWPESSLVCRGRFAAAFTGTLDNSDELIRANGNADHKGPQSAGLVLDLFTELGELAAARLRGTFAAIITDGERLWAFRDHVGFRTLFYRCAQGKMFLATEAKQVLAGSAIARQPDIETVERIFFADLDVCSPSALKGVERLPNATILSSDGHSVALRRFWQPEQVVETSRMSPADVQDRFDELMGQAARRMLKGRDVVALSGGVDSPAVAAYAAPIHREMTGQPLGALSAVYPRLPVVDEQSYIELVASRLGLELHLYEQQAQPFDSLDDWAWLLDGPPQTIALPEVEEHYRLASRLGYRNMLGGEVAEVVFEEKSYLLAHLLRTGRLRPLWRLIRSQRARGMSTRGILNQLGHAYVPRPIAASFQRRRRTYRGRQVPVWLDERRVKEEAARAAVPAGRRWLQGQLAFFGPPSVSVEADDICQAVTEVRARRPWADVDLWEFFLSLPAEIKFPAAGSKVLVRRLLRGRVPDEILDRHDKTVFDDFFVSRMDYAALRRWLIDPPQRVAGVKYDILRVRLEGALLSMNELLWAKELAAVHAFLFTFK